MDAYQIQRLMCSTENLAANELHIADSSHVNLSVRVEGVRFRSWRTGVGMLRWPDLQVKELNH